jgi:transcriptional regulator with XRE-family HTH domain
MVRRRNRVAERIKKIRRDERLTQAEAAARAGVSHVTWQRWEHGRSEPYFGNVVGLCEEFRIPLSDFCERSEYGEDDPLKEVEARLEEMLAYVRSVRGPVAGQNHLLEAAMAAAPTIRRRARTAMRLPEAQPRSASRRRAG